MKTKIIAYLITVMFLFGSSGVLANESSESGICYVFNEGYLVDENVDGTYDSFYSNLKESTTKVGKLSDGRYLIDTKGNGFWDYVYDPTTETYSLYSSSIDPAKSPADYLPWAVLAALIATITSIVVIFLFPGKELRRNE